MENVLITTLQTSEIAETEKSVLLQTFETFFAQANEWEKKAKNIVITSVDQKAEMKMAREARLALKTLRVETEKKRKSLKEDALRKGQTIDAIARIITNTIVPIETYLEEQEKFVEIQEAKRKEELKEKRIAELTPYEVDTTFIDLSNMTDEAYDSFLISSKDAYNAKLAEIKRIEDERIAKEKADEEMRKENARLKEEAEAKEKELQAEREAIEKQRAEEKAKADAELKKAEDALRAEKEAKEKIERESIEKALAEENARRLEAEAKEKELQRLQSLSTSGHLKVLHDYMSTISLPEFTDDEKYTNIRTKINDQLQKLGDRVLELSTTN